MSILFSPISIGSMTVKNRFVRSATQDWLGDENGYLTDRSYALYKELAKNDVGLIVTAHSYVSYPRGKASPKQNAVYDDSFIEGYAALATIVHAYGAKIVLQVSHAGVQTTLENTQGVAPAATNTLTEAEIQDIIRCYAQAVRRAQLAGCDGVQLHLAHGYLLSRFLSPQSNLRTDQWGGSVENRLRIVTEIVYQSRQWVGKDFPILVKLNSSGGFLGTAAIPIQDVVEIAVRLEQLGICAIEVSGGVTSEPENSLSWLGITTEEKEGYFAENAKMIKDAVHIPVILVGGLRSRSVMEQVLESRTADMVSMSRPFVREPDLVRRLAQGQDKAACISCNQCRNIEGIACPFTAD